MFGVSGVQLKRASRWFKAKLSGIVFAVFASDTKISFPFYELPFHFWWMHSRRCHVNIHCSKVTGRAFRFKPKIQDTRQIAVMNTKRCSLKVVNDSQWHNFEQHNAAVIIRSKLWHKTRELTVKVFRVLGVCDFDTLKWNLVRGLRWGVVRELRHVGNLKICQTWGKNFKGWRK